MGIKRLIRFSALLAAAVLAGMLIALLRVRVLANIDDIRVGPWRTSSLIGSSQASPYLRAVIAVNGILALNQKEAIYFSAATDDAGRILSGRCDYRVSGGDIATRWWSLTAYGTDRFLIPTPTHRYSVDGNSVSRDAAGHYSIALGQASASERLDRDRRQRVHANTESLWSGSVIA